MQEITTATVPAVQVQKASPTEAPAKRWTVGQPSSVQMDYRVIAQPSVARKSVLEKDLAVMDRAWRKYRSNHDRDAVYIYLASVFDIVMRSRVRECSLKQSRTALRLRPTPLRLTPEPFAQL